MNCPRASLYPGPGPNLRLFLPPLSIGTGGNNYDVAATDSTGCGVKDTRGASCGLAFNAGGGGFYAMQRTAAGIGIWFWPRDAGGIPEDVAAAEGRIDTGAWVRSYCVL